MLWPFMLLILTSTCRCIGRIGKEGGDIDTDRLDRQLDKWLDLVGLGSSGRGHRLLFQRSEEKEKS